MTIEIYSYRGFKWTSKAEKEPLEIDKNCKNKSWITSVAAIKDFMTQSIANTAAKYKCEFQELMLDGQYEMA